MNQPRPTAARLRRQLAERLAEGGHVTSPGWRSAVDAVPRHAFLSTGVFRPVPGSAPTSYTPTLADEQSEAWLALCYADETLVTQIAGTVLPQDITGSIARQPSSSSTLPSLMLDMLEALDVEDGHRVLEIGTGTGYNAALLAHRVGAGNVTTVETDPDVAHRARSALHACGHPATVIVGDGRFGCPERAPYDRVIATCGVSRVRPEWVAQTRQGGVILTTVRGGLWSSGLAKLTVGENGTAEGVFVSEASFMRARQEETSGSVMFPSPDEGNARATGLGPEIADDWTARFVIDSTLDGVNLFQAVSLQGEPPADYWFHEPSGSFAVVGGNPGDGWTVRQGGPVSLWDTVERAIGAWRDAGSPSVTDFRVRITSDRQEIFTEKAPNTRWGKPVERLA
ncbi:ATP-grasp peptide maturase system methyltransferase [Streptomyces avicenniae]|uniref:ATP-grasp peptide maturase system methyltransferase n=1 Tax=Streptomyces avicenniae TaxID=500153 RepID=UPI000699B3B5|nr:ATP-grasp peptide maturase system methyltransferase [Streptomyces avicenniae]